MPKGVWYSYKKIIVLNNYWTPNVLFFKMICLPNILSLKDKICINFFAMTLFGLGCMQKNCCVETHGSHHRYVKTMQLIFFSSVGSWVDRQEDSRYLQAFSMNSQPLATDTNMGLLGYSVDRQEDSIYVQAFSMNTQPLATDTNMGYSVDRLEDSRYLQAFSMNSQPLHGNRY